MHITPYQAPTRLSALKQPPAGTPQAAINVTVIFSRLPQGVAVSVFITRSSIDANQQAAARQLEQMLAMHSLMLIGLLACIAMQGPRIPTGFNAAQPADTARGPYGPVRESHKPAPGQYSSRPHASNPQPAPQPAGPSSSAPPGREYRPADAPRPPESASQAEEPSPEMEQTTMRSNMTRAEARALFGFEQGADASTEEVKKKFKAQALKLHPDKLAPEEREAGAEKFKAWKEAHDILVGNWKAADDK